MDSVYIVDEEFPIYYLDCQNAFRNLSKEEKAYAYSLTKAGWTGALIDLLQCSPESPGIFIIAQKIFKAQTPDEIRSLIKSLGYDEIDAKNFLNYFALMYDNLGNYRSFGDSKFIPRIEGDKFHHILTSTKAYTNDEHVRDIYKIIKPALYSLTNKNKQLGLGEEGVSTYYSSNCDIEDAKLVQCYLDENNVSPYNTRVFKSSKDGIITYEVRQASVEQSKTIELHVGNPKGGIKVMLVNGDYSELMQLMVSELETTGQIALNDIEKQMIKCYIDSFKTGSIEDHKNGSRWWIKDKGPIVENYIGFIESYRDPLGVRGEFEAFIAVVNKEMSEKFNELVQSAPTILKELPWPKEYEKDKFLQPDFTSLDVINFANSGMPVGINIPNYDDIRQNDGFKNVSLGNVLKARFQDPKANFLSESDKSLYISCAAESFEIQVGLHELIGHGSGKLLAMKNGVKNFDYNEMQDLINGGPICSWYNDNETYDGVFKSLASPFEECRAESVGLYLCSLPQVLAIFGHHNVEISNNIFYVNWLSMIKAAIISMEFYTPSQKRWRQAHCQARFAIFNVLLEAGENLVNIEEIIASDGKPDLVIHLDRTKIQSVGRPALEKFLLKLQFFKSTASCHEAQKLFDHYTILDERFLNLRQIVIDRKLPRAATVQCGLKETSDGDFEIIEYANTVDGMIQSFVERFNGNEAEEAIYKVWSKDIPYFTF